LEFQKCNVKEKKKEKKERKREKKKKTILILARILEWVAISFSRGSSRPRDRTQVSFIAGRRFNL